MPGGGMSKRSICQPASTSRRRARRRSSRGVCALSFSSFRRVCSGSLPNAARAWRGTERGKTMVEGDAPYHAHIYYSADERAAAEALRERFVLRTRGEESVILFVGRMLDRGVGPHPIPQFEIHFRERAVPAVAAAIEASGLRALVHP